jgi:hypothetical protein
MLTLLSWVTWGYLSPSWPLDDCLLPSLASQRTCTFPGNWSALGSHHQSKATYSVSQEAAPELSPRDPGRQSGIVEEGCRLRLTGRKAREGLPGLHLNQFPAQPPALLEGKQPFDLSDRWPLQTQWEVQFSQKEEG